MNSSTLTDLAARVERLTRHDRQLGAEIICHVKGYRLLAWESRGTDLNPHIINIAAEADGQRFEFWANDPTASLDAAMTLVPEGWPITDFAYWPSVPVGYESERCCRLIITDLDAQGFGGRNRYKAQALTPALALTAASLRARAALASSVTAVKRNNEAG